MDHEDYIEVELYVPPKDPMEKLNMILFPKASSVPVVVESLEDLRYAFVL